MKIPILATALLVCSCAAPPPPPPPPPTLHDHLAGGRSQITPINAPQEAMAGAVTTAVAAQSLKVIQTEVGDTWGRIAAVDAQGVSYVLSWEPATAPLGDDADGPCVLLFVSCNPSDGAVRLGQLAQAVRRAAEGAG